MVNPAELLREIEEFRFSRDLFDQAAIAHVDSVAVDDFEVPRITNELWTAQQRRSNSLHELSYRACFKAELPRFFVERLTNPGDRVLDPFMGRGTTLLESALLGRVPCGNDVNPLSPILLEPRLDPPELADVEARIDDILQQEDPGSDADEPELSVFFEAETLGELRAMRRWFLDRDAAGELDRVDRWLRMVATNRLTGHSSGFFSGRTMPPNQAVSVESQKKINTRLGVVPPRRDVREILVRKTRSLQRSLDAALRARLTEAFAQRCLSTGDSRDLSAFASDSIRCTVTSPPFLNVVNYAQDNWLRCWFNGLDAEAIADGITTSGKLDAWCGFLQPVFEELYRVTSPGGWVVFEVGEVRGGELLLEEPVLPLARSAGFCPVGVVVHAQEFTKTANCWGVTNNSKGTNTNRLVLLHKDRE